ncbi:MAG: hypothetical protein M1820_007648 [Bogoriella megaspora]|nr:MAG: hypothetical protein M1820_007648 [Bogoriella megaspora]
MSKQFSLAHFCEYHGPTSILCTQVLPVTCSTCNGPPGTPRSSQSTPSPPTKEWAPTLYTGSALNVSLETPPTSPATAVSRDNPYFPPSRSSTEHTYRRYSGSYETRDDSCANCTFSLPKDVSQRLPDGAPGSPTKDGKGRHGSPVLRSREAVMVPGTAIHSEDEFSSSGPDGDTSSSDTEQPHQHHHSLRTTTTTLRIHPTMTRSQTTSSSSDSALSHPHPHSTHKHTITYLTTRQPPSPTAYTLLRRSCINTLSVENLPRGTSAGFLMFGDAHKGYTLAYVFRVPDPRARGRLRTYALIMLGGSDSWRTTFAYRIVTRAFENIAAQIVSMANRVIEREFGSAGGSGSGSSSPETLKSDSAYGGSVGGSATRSITPVSSFLVAKKVDPDGYPRGSSEAMSAKGLGEIVGSENFFVELHAQFVRLLATLTREFGL